MDVRNRDVGAISVAYLAMPNKYAFMPPQSDFDQQKLESGRVYYAQTKSVALYRR